MIKWVHDRTPSLPAVFRPCGFCVSGNSGGASQVAYALARYGLDAIVDVVAPTSGPPHAAIADGCRAIGAEISYSRANARTIDSSSGFLNGSGPCEVRNPGWLPRWTEQSVDVGGDYVHPTTAVRFILGARDEGAAPPHAWAYINRLRAANSPRVGATVVSCMEHRIQDSPERLAALGQALLGGGPLSPFGPGDRRPAATGCATQPA